MEHLQINWDEVPEIITKEQLWKLCHISKTTARYLLLSGKIPCQNSGAQTRCYQILKKDVIHYLADREKYPEYYTAPKNWYAAIPNHDIVEHLPKITKDMHPYFGHVLRDFPDVMDNQMISKFTGHSKTAINNWCLDGLLQHFVIKGRNAIPKTYLIDFFALITFEISGEKQIGT